MLFVGKSLCYGAVATIYDQAAATTVTLCHQGQPSPGTAKHGGENRSEEGRLDPVMNVCEHVRFCAQEEGA